MKQETAALTTINLEKNNYSNLSLYESLEDDPMVRMAVKP